ncbi:hypothetical protein BDN67DRAFT_126284 [Paxillus ammoniavirescens]|nr:hypothetical protein BDN67DRAFT_126284 [Paxillus ammoniavirescens]
MSTKHQLVFDSQPPSKSHPSYYRVRLKRHAPKRPLPSELTLQGSRICIIFLHAALAVRTFPRSHQQEKLSLKCLLQLRPTSSESLITSINENSLALQGSTRMRLFPNHCVKA